MWPSINIADLAYSFSNMSVLYPLLTIVCGAFFILLYTAFLKPKNPVIVQMMALLILIVANYFAISSWHSKTQAIFNSAFYLDHFSIVMYFILNFLTAFTILSSGNVIAKRKIPEGEYYALILLALSGMYLMVSAREFLTLFIALEIMSISAYILTGIHKKNLSANEAAVKYLLLGSFASGIFIFGIALLYGSTGSTNFATIAMRLTNITLGADPTSFLMTTGFLFVLMGFAFKISVVPFHMWAPDVYEGAITPITGFMATAVKGTAIASLLRVLLSAFYPIEAYWQPLFGVLAVLTMFVGNLCAILQSSLKRMLAYSSIAHAGYVMVALSALTKNDTLAGSAILFYIIVYGFMTLGSFTILSIVEKDADKLPEDAFYGLGFKRPCLAFSMTVFMLSLTGMPFTAGFIGKLFIFNAAIQAKQYYLVVFLALNSAISAYYYLRVIVHMYMKESNDLLTDRLSFSQHVILGISSFLILFWGLFPSGLFELIRTSLGGMN